jgi:Flp pilus assembly protein CpaB
MPRSDRTLATFLQAVSGWPRWVAIAGCLLAALISAFRTGHARPAASTVSVVIASRALPAGAVLKAGDLTTTQWPQPSDPPGATRAASGLLGRRTAVALARGAPVLGQSLLEVAMATALESGRVATTVELATAGQLAILRAGQTIDLYLGPDEGLTIEGKSADPVGSPKAFAHDATVLSVLPPDQSNVQTTKPTLVIATDKDAAAQIAVHPRAEFLATLVRPP